MRHAHGAPRFALVLSSLLALTAAARAQEGDPAMAGEMTGALMEMPHMEMTPLRAARPGDEARARAVLEHLRPALEHYRDYRAALADGFAPFLPRVPQKVYHFTSRRNAIAAVFTFDDARPTSLLYEKTADGYRLVGAMYTAPRGASLDALDARVPLSVGQWHRHTNICLPPRGEPARWREGENGHPRFGPAGTIATRSACDAAGGRFVPAIFGWMIHVNPYASDPRLVWGAHQHDEHAEMMHD